MEFLCLEAKRKMVGEENGSKVKGKLQGKCFSLPTPRNLDPSHSNVIIYYCFDQIVAVKN